MLTYEHILIAIILTAAAVVAVVLALGAVVLTAVYVAVKADTIRLINQLERARAEHGKS